MTTQYFRFDIFRIIVLTKRLKIIIASMKKNHKEDKKNDLSHARLKHERPKVFPKLAV